MPDEALAALFVLKLQFVMQNVPGDTLRKSPRSFPEHPWKAGLQARSHSRVLPRSAENFISISSAEILIVPTFQRSTLDLVKMGEAIEAEKDRLLMLVGHTCCLS